MACVPSAGLCAAVAAVALDENERLSSAEDQHTTDALEDWRSSHVVRSVPVADSSEESDSSSTEAHHEQDKHHKTPPWVTPQEQKRTRSVEYGPDPEPLEPPALPLDAQAQERLSSAEDHHTTEAGEEESAAGSTEVAISQSAKQMVHRYKHELTHGTYQRSGKAIDNVDDIQSRRSFVRNYAKKLPVSKQRSALLKLVESSKDMVERLTNIKIDTEAIVTAVGEMNTVLTEVKNMVSEVHSVNVKAEMIVDDTTPAIAIKHQIREIKGELTKRNELLAERRAQEKTDREMKRADMMLLREAKRAIAVAEPQRVIAELQDEGQRCGAVLKNGNTCRRRTRNGMTCRACKKAAESQCAESEADGALPVAEHARQA